MSDSAKRLLHKARQKQAGDWLGSNLLIAAAVSLVLSETVIIVGGTAEAYWTGRDVYHPTDLDLWIAGPTDRGSAVATALEALGFTRDGRHWVPPGLNVPVEFPSGPFAGSLERLKEDHPGGANVLVIGLDDLYLDRLRQATASANENGVEFQSALSVATHRFDAIDWRYVSSRIAKERQSSELLGGAMDLCSRRVRRLVRQRLSEA